MAPPASTVTVLVSNTASGVNMLTKGMGLVSPTGAYILYPLGGTSGEAVVRRRSPDGTLGAIVWSSFWPNALQASGGSTLGESRQLRLETARW